MADKSAELIIHARHECLINWPRDYYPWSYQRGSMTSVINTLVGRVLKDNILKILKNNHKCFYFKKENDPIVFLFEPVI